MTSDLTTERRASAPALAIATLASAQLMLVLDVTVVNVALPDIGTSLGLERDALTWVMTIYVTLFGGLVLAGGKAADSLGPRRVLVAGLVLFMSASLLSALATNGATLLGGRALQGVAAALVSPAALAVLLGSVPDAARGRALAAWGLLSAVGTALGVSIGGFLTSTLGWEWIFAVNVPVGLAVLLVLPLVTRPVPGTPVRPDWAGAALVTAGTGLVVFGLVRAGNTGWTSAGTIAALLSGLALWCAFGVVERRVQEPMLRIGLLAEAPVAAGAFLMIVATGLMVGNFFLGSFTLQRAYGDEALRVGLLFLPAAVAVGCGAHVAGHLLDRLSPRVVAVVALAIAAGGEGVAALSEGRRTVLVVGLTVGALGIGGVFVTAFRAALATAGPTDGGLRSAIVSTAHEFGGAVGVAVLSTVAAAALTAASPVPKDFSGAYAWAAFAAAAAAAVAGALVPSEVLPTSADHTQGHH